ncbi:MAG: glycosyltransferase family 4 protein [Candidatus Shapirobacteria bacterium]|jgi:glycosyltransferase involved in cell wall biosynthesis
MARVLLISHICPPAIDGGSRVIHKVGDYFKTQGHTVASLCSDASSTDDFTHSYRTIFTKPNSNNSKFKLPVYTIFHRPLKLVSRLFPIFSVFTKGPIFKPFPFLKFLKFYLQFKPDYIIAGPLPTTIVLYANFLRLISNFIIRHQTKILVNASFHPTDKDFHNPFLIHALKSSDFIWTLTDFETNYFHQHFGIPLSKMINVGNGIDRSLLIKVPRLKLSKVLKLLYIGSFAAHKGIEVIIDSLKHLPPTTTLTLAGQTTLYSPVIRSKIKKLPKSYQNRISLINSFSDVDLKKLLDKCSILISASTQESFGIVLLEAMARGIPVIGADIPTSTELINRSNAGIIFRTGDPLDLSKKINSLNNPQDLKLYGSQGLSYATTHTWDRIGESLWQKISSS